MGVPLIRRLLLAGLTAVGFGVLWSVAKGNAGGVRAAAGNLSAPWVILPLLGGALTARAKLVLGALVGLAMTLIALSAFYFTNAFVLDLGPHSSLADIHLTMHAVGDIWFRYGVLSGLAFGAGGAWIAGRSSLGTVGAVVAVLLVGEPVALLAWHQIGGLGFTPDPAVSTVEVGVGIALAAGLFLRHRQHD